MIRTSSRLAALALSVALLAAPALAQQKEPSATHLAAARDVVVSSGMTRSFSSIVPTFLDQVRRQVVTRPELTKDLDAVFEGLRPELEMQEQVMTGRAARAFAARLTEDECKQIAGFFNSPIGKRWVETQPVVLDDLVREMQAWSGELAEYIQVRVRAEMAKRGHQM